MITQRARPDLVRTWASVVSCPSGTAYTTAVQLASEMCRVFLSIAADGRSFPAPKKGDRMRTVEQWLQEYGESHRHATNKTLHWICVPIIVVSLIGLMWSLPTPASWREISP